MQGRCGVIVSNIPSYAGGRRIGESDVTATVLTITPLRSFWDLARLILKGSLFHAPALPFTHTMSLELCGHPLPVQRDGEVGEFNEGFIRLAGNVRIAI